MTIQSNLRTLLTCLGTATLIAACTTPPPPPPAPAARPPVVVAPAAPAPPAPLKSHATTVEGYKRDVAMEIHRANPQHLFDGVPPPFLKSVVVLSITVDAKGHPEKVELFRSNGYADLDELAMRSVRDAAPLPQPNGVLTNAGTVQFTESWLFRDDGRFQIRTLAQAQAKTAGD
jgi:protein TonB